MPPASSLPAVRQPARRRRHAGRHRRLAIIVLGLILVVAGQTVAAPGRAEPITIATHPEGSSFHRLGVALADILAGGSETAAQVKSFGRWSDYLPLINENQVTVGFATGLSAAELAGDGGRRRFGDVRALARLWPIRYTFLARASLRIESVVGLRGKRMVLDVANDPALGAVNRAILSTVGLRDRDVRATAVQSLGEAVSQLVRGEIDVIPIAVGVPLVRRLTKEIAGGVNYVTLIGPNATDDFLGKHTPGLYTIEVEPAKRLAVLDKKILVVGFDVFLIGAALAPDAVTGAVAKALHESFTALQAEHPVLRTGAASLVGAPTNPIPYHPGAVTYFKSKGLWTADNDRVEAVLGTK